MCRAVAIRPVDPGAPRWIGEAGRCRTTGNRGRWGRPALQERDRVLQLGEALLQIGLPRGEGLHLCRLVVDLGLELLDVGARVVAGLRQRLGELVEVGLERRVHGG